MQRIGVGEARAGDRADADHRRVGHPPGQDRVDKAAAVQDGGGQHRAEHQPARQPQLAKHQRRDGGHGDQDRQAPASTAGRPRRSAPSGRRPPPSARNRRARPECRASAPPRAWSARWRWRGGRPCTRTDSVITCASAPGLAPNSADCAVPAVHEAQIRAGGGDHAQRRNRQHQRRSSGNAASPFSVSGDTTAPSEMPTSTEMTRDSGAGMVHRPAAAAPPSPRRAASRSRARGKPEPVQRDAAHVPRSPAFRRAQPFGLRWNRGRRHRRDQCRAGESAVKRRYVWSRELRVRERPALIFPAAARSGPDRRHSWRRAFHDAGAMHLDGARADAERAAGLLVGRAGDDLLEHARAHATDVAP